MAEQLWRFARHYRGRHAPEDALWWLDHPESAGPSGAPPPQQMFLNAADELRARGLAAAEAALLEVLADLLKTDRDATLRALRDSEEDRRHDD